MVLMNPKLYLQITFGNICNTAFTGGSVNVSLNLNGQIVIPIPTRQRYFLHITMIEHHVTKPSVNRV